MSPILLTRSKHIFAIAKFLQGNGEPVERLLRRAELPSTCLENPESLIPSHAAFHFRELAARCTGLPNIALDAAQNLQIADLGNFGKMLLAEPTLAAAARQFLRLMHTQTTTSTIELQRQENGDVMFCHRLKLRRHPGRWHSDLYILGWMVKAARLAAPNWSPTHITVSSPATPDRKRAIDSLGGSTVRFGSGYTGFAIPNSMLALPVSKLVSGQGVTEASQLQLEKTAPADNLIDSLKQVLLAYRRDRWLSIEQAAEVSNISVRTLQRRLADERANFTAIVDLTRLGVAAAMLESTELKIVDIAAELGYSTQGNFTRAFVRWAGVSPTVFRKQRRDV
jgi:AraC-like DNA-binding protein